MKNKLINCLQGINDSEFLILSTLVYQTFGISLATKKKALGEGQSNRLIRQLGFINFIQYYDYLLADTSRESLLSLVDKISTNHSYFFRENEHFDYLKDVLIPDIIKNKKQKQLRIWCAGCAAGQESYSIAMLIKEYFGKDFEGWDIGILATDISTSSLENAKQGLYQQEQLKNIPAEYRKYFNVDEESISIKDSIKDMVLYKKLNLMRSSFPFKSKFDIVFCRNVIIYFDQQTRMNLISNIHDVVNNNGHLFIGHSETLQKQTNLYKYVGTGIYKKN